MKSKKIYPVFPLLLVMLALLAGCASSAPDDGNTAVKGSTGPLKITDSLTWEDPADLEFDARYVVYCDKDTEQLSYHLEAGATDLYFVIYAQGDTVVAEHSFMLFDTAENARAYVDAQAEAGLSDSVSETDATVVCNQSDAQALEDTFTIYRTYGVLDDTSTQGYINFTLESTGGVLLD